MNDVIGWRNTRPGSTMVDGRRRGFMCHVDTTTKRIHVLFRERTCASGTCMCQHFILRCRGYLTRAHPRYTLARKGSAQRGAFGPAYGSS